MLFLKFKTELMVFKAFRAFKVLRVKMEKLPISMTTVSGALVTLTQE